jgi:hypothetical protein
MKILEQLCTCLGAVMWGSRGEVKNLDEKAIVKVFPTSSRTEVSMSSRRQIPKKNSNHSSLTPAVNPLKSRGFGSGIQARSAALPRTTLLQTLNKEKADELLPVDTYREAVLKKINPLLDKGAQILVGMENHFVRLDALDQEDIQVDDPGERGFKNLSVKWEEARNLGYFKGFWEITG